MNHPRIRRQIEFDAAQRLRSGRSDDVSAARHAAARKLVRGWVPDDVMPEDQEILAEVAGLSELPEGDDDTAALRLLLAPLEHIRMTPRAEHPEGDALYHSLQTFELAREAAPHDVELQTAALVHEVGRAVDSKMPESVTLELLDGLITERTRWLLEHLPEEIRRRRGTLGGRAVRRLRTAEDAEALALLGRCDDEARVMGGAAPELDEALKAIEFSEDW